MGLGSNESKYHELKEDVNDELFAEEDVEFQIDERAPLLEDEAASQEIVSDRKDRIRRRPYKQISATSNKSKSFKEEPAKKLKKFRTDPDIGWIASDAKIIASLSLKPYKGFNASTVQNVKQYKAEIEGELAEYYLTGNAELGIGADLRKAEAIQGIKRKETAKQKILEPGKFIYFKRFNSARLFALRLHRIFTYSGRTLPLLSKMTSYGGLSYIIELCVYLNDIFIETVFPENYQKHIPWWSRLKNAFMKDERPLEVANAAVWFGVNLASLFLTGGASAIINAALFCFDFCADSYKVLRDYLKYNRSLNKIQNEIAFLHERLEDYKKIVDSHKGDLISNIDPARRDVLNASIVQIEEKIAAINAKIENYTYLKSQVEIQKKSVLENKWYGAIVTTIIVAGMIAILLFPPTSMASALLLAVIVFTCSVVGGFGRQMYMSIKERLAKKPTSEIELQTTKKEGEPAIEERDKLARQKIDTLKLEVVKENKDQDKKLTDEEINKLARERFKKEDLSKELAASKKRLNRVRYLTEASVVPTPKNYMLHVVSELPNDANKDQFKNRYMLVIPEKLYFSRMENEAPVAVEIENFNHLLDVIKDKNKSGYRLISAVSYLGSEIEQESKQPENWHPLLKQKQPSIEPKHVCQFFYIDKNGVSAEVAITDFNKLIQLVNGLTKDSYIDEEGFRRSPKKIILSMAQIQEYITNNGGHYPEDYQPLVRSASGDVKLHPADNSNQSQMMLTSSNSMEASFHSAQNQSHMKPAFIDLTTLAVQNDSQRLPDVLVMNTAQFDEPSVADEKRPLLPLEIPSSDETEEINRSSRSTTSNLLVAQMSAADLETLTAHRIDPRRTSSATPPPYAVPRFTRIFSSSLLAVDASPSSARSGMVVQSPSSPALSSSSVV